MYADLLQKFRMEQSNRKIEELEKKVAEQGRNDPASENKRNWHVERQEELTKANLVTKQSEQFQELIDNFSRFYEEDIPYHQEGQKVKKNLNLNR